MGNKTATNHEGKVKITKKVKEKRILLF